MKAKEFEKQFDDGIDLWRRWIYPNSGFAGATAREC
jgi:hypothetical protein